MSQHRLKVFRTDEAEGIPAPHAPHMVPMPLAELVELIGDAKDNRRTWLSDFVDDEIAVPEDLYELLSAYRRLPKGA